MPREAKMGNQTQVEVRMLRADLYKIRRARSQMGTTIANLVIDDSSLAVVDKNYNN
jgi:hypothetical protein